MGFEHKDYVWLLAAVPLMGLLFLLMVQWKKRVKKRIGDERLVNALTSSYSPKFFAVKFFLIMIAFGLGVIALMNPRDPGSSQVQNRKGIDLAIALDISKSMLATDLAPSRLERAKQFIIKLMNAMPDDRVALILFAGRAYLQMPLSVDHGAAQLFVSAAGPEAVPQQGTVISEALEKSNYALAGVSGKFKSIILISDGETHDGEAVAMAKKLADQGVMINSVGIGSPEGSTLIEPTTGDLKKDESGNPVISKLNEDILTEIAITTNGIYVRLQNSEEAVNKITGQLSQIERKAFTDLTQVDFKSFYTWGAALMFVLLFVEIFIPGTKLNLVKLKKPVAV